MGSLKRARRESAQPQVAVAKTFKGPPRHPSASHLHVALVLCAQRGRKHKSTHDSSANHQVSGRLPKASGRQSNNKSQIGSGRQMNNITMLTRLGAARPPEVSRTRIGRPVESDSEQAADTNAPGCCSCTYIILCNSHATGVSKTWAAGGQVTLGSAGTCQRSLLSLQTRESGSQVQPPCYKERMCSRSRLVTARYNLARP